MIYQRFVTFSLLFFSGILLFNLGNLTPRNEFSFLLGQVIFLALLLGIVYYRNLKQIDGFSSINIYIGAGLVFRFVLLFSLPLFSDDFYRFLWDGNLVINGINPYISTPAAMEILEKSSYTTVLLDKMNSPMYFSVYPPLNQWMFSLACFIIKDSVFGQVMVLKSLVFISETLIIFSLPKLMKLLGLKIHFALLYILNPLVIIETVGNLHFESMTVMFMVLFLIQAIRKNYWLSAIYFAFSVHVKLIPLIILPMLFVWLKPSEWIKYILTLVVVSCLLIMPFIHQGIVENFYSGYGYYFEKFEFNASLYYLLREIGFWITGYNQIQVLGTSLVVFWFIGLIWMMRKVHLKKDQVIVAMYFLFVAYYFCATTVHPWYIINVLMLGIWAGYGYSAVCWSFTAFLSYSAYSSVPVQENLYLVLLEYILFVSVLIFEIKKRRGWINNLEHVNAL